MRLNSARRVWHDCFYSRGDSAIAFAIERARLGGAVQMTEIDGRTAAAVHQALAGRVQMAIDTLPHYLRDFGNWMYSPLADDDCREIAEAAVFVSAYTAANRMTAKKRDRARYVAKGVLARYRRMHQGGQSANADPMRNPEAFRNWLSDVYGVELSSESWGREWVGFIKLCFDACDDLDRAALAPVARVLSAMLDRSAETV